MDEENHTIIYVDHTDTEVLVVDLNHRENQNREDRSRPSIIAYRDPGSGLVTGILLSFDFIGENPVSGSLPIHTPMEESEGL